MPPQIFTREEFEALVLGLRETQAAADPALAKAAEHALAKLHALLPPRSKGYLKHLVLHAKRFSSRPAITIDVRQLREAAWLERTIGISDFVGELPEAFLIEITFVHRKQQIL